MRGGGGGLSPQKQAKKQTDYKKVKGYYRLKDEFDTTEDILKSTRIHKRFKSHTNRKRES